MTAYFVSVAALAGAIAACLAMLLRMPAWLGHTPEVRAARRASLVSALVLGMLAALGVTAVVRWLGRVTGISPVGHSATDWAALLAMLLFFTPFEAALEAGLTWSLLRSRWFRDTLDGILNACTLAFGFGCVAAGLHLGQLRGSDLSPLRGLLSVPAQVFCAGIWGFTMGRARKKRRRLGTVFAGAWLGATMLRAFYEHLIFAKGAAALLSAVPLLGGMGAITYLAYRDLRDELAPRASQPPSARTRRSFLPSLPPPPSLLAMRAALRRAERPVAIRWIVAGALVTTGVMLVSVVSTVILARRLGVDFGAVDEGAMGSTVPLALLGGAVLLAFPIAGFLVARASATDSVLEPALSAGLSIAGTFVMLGLAAPVALVFALAFAPFAFGLACAGAWVGIGGTQ